VWAALIDVNRARFRGHARPIFGYRDWCRQIAGVTVGELSVTALRSVVRRYAPQAGLGAAALVLGHLQRRAPEPQPGTGKLVMGTVLK
jgi:hypothetical protein